MSLVFTGGRSTELTSEPVLCNPMKGGEKGGEKNKSFTRDQNQVRGLKRGRKPGHLQNGADRLGVVLGLQMCGETGGG